MYPGCEYAGKLINSDVGITRESFCGRLPVYFYYDEDPKALLPERRKDSNKGTNGKVLVVAGSKHISGACILAATAALRCGAGMVRVFTAAENAEIVKTTLPEALIDTVDDFEPASDKLKEAIKWCDSIVIGPGIGTDQRASFNSSEIL